MSIITVNLEKVIQRKRNESPNEKLTAERIALHTGLALNTVRAWMRRSIKSADLQTLATLCDFFECSPADILEYQSDSIDK